MHSGTETNGKSLLIIGCPTSSYISNWRHPCPSPKYTNRPKLQLDQSVHTSSLFVIKCSYLSSIRSIPREEKMYTFYCGSVRWRAKQKRKNVVVPVVGVVNEYNRNHGGNRVSYVGYTCVVYRVNNVYV